MVGGNVSRAPCCLIAPAGHPRNGLYFFIALQLSLQNFYAIIAIRNPCDTDTDTDTEAEAERGYRPYFARAGSSRWRNGSVAA
jgi:hypothetical protein